MKFAKPRLVRFGVAQGGNITWSSVTDHNRTPLAITYNTIENRKRMADGTLRKQFIANKHKWATSFDQLPGYASQTVDKFMGANDLENFYLANQGAFYLELTYGDNSVEVYTVMFVDFSNSLQKRGAVDLYSVDLSLEEV
jgi:hypothetical protein